MVDKQDIFLNRKFENSLNRRLWKQRLKNIWNSPMIFQDFDDQTEFIL